jgi:hypothetical protein
MSRRAVTTGVVIAVGVLLLQYMVWSNVPYAPVGLRYEQLRAVFLVCARRWAAGGGSELGSAGDYAADQGDHSRSESP